MKRKTRVLFAWSINGWIALTGLKRNYVVTASHVKVLQTIFAIILSRPKCANSFKNLPKPAMNKKKENLRAVNET